MTTKNDITGDEIKTGVVTEAYRSGWDRIFGGSPSAIRHQSSAIAVFDRVAAKHGDSINSDHQGAERGLLTGGAGDAETGGDCGGDE